MVLGKFRQKCLALFVKQSLNFHKFFVVVVLQFLFKGRWDAFANAGKIARFWTVGPLGPCLQAGCSLEVRRAGTGRGGCPWSAGGGHREGSAGQLLRFPSTACSPSPVLTWTWEWPRDSRRVWPDLAKPRTGPQPPSLAGEGVLGTCHKPGPELGLFSELIE